MCRFGPDEDLPKTKTKKYIRVGLAEKLGFSEEKGVGAAPKKVKVGSFLLLILHLFTCRSNSISTFTGYG